MAERARIDDVALTLCYADTELGQTTSGDRIAAPQPLVRAYVSGPSSRRCPGPSPGSRCGASAAGSRCSTTRTPPGRMLAPPFPRSLQLVADIDTWQTRLTWRAPNTQLSTALRQFRHNERCAEPITAALVATAIRARPPASRGHSTRAAASLR